jgi:hypothetical protein
LALCVLLTGCNETTGSIQEPIKAVARAPAANPDASPRGASVALSLTAIEGVPTGVVAQFTQAFAHAAEARDVSLADPKLAKYFVQLHLTAYSAGTDATALAYVSDVFDGKKHRTQRLGDEIMLKGTAADPWSLVDAKTIEAIAARGADDLAAFLSNTPEAVAGAAMRPVARSPDMPANALGFSAVRE